LKILNFTGTPEWKNQGDKYFTLGDTVPTLKNQTFHIIYFCNRDS